MIDYIGFELQVHGLNFKTNKEINNFKREIASAVRKIHPHLRFDSDVSLSTLEYAGELEEPMGEQK